MSHEFMLSVLVQAVSGCIIIWQIGRFTGRTEQRLDDRDKAHGELKTRVGALEHDHHQLDKRVTAVEAMCDARHEGN